VSKTATTGKKTSKTLDELEDSLGDLDGSADAKALKKKVQAEVDKGPQFDAEPEDRAPASTGDFVGARVKFDGDTDGMLGTVVQQDGDKVVIRDDEGGSWNSWVNSFEVVAPAAKAAAPASAEAEDRAPAGVPTAEAPAAEQKPAKGKKGSKSKAPVGEGEAVVAAGKDEPKAPHAGKTPNELVYDVRAVKVSEVKVPDLYPRKLDPASEEYQKIKADLEENPQEDAVVLDSWDKKNLVEGLTRLSIFKELGRTVILARVKAGIETEEQRFYQGVRLNDRRNSMHWLDYARAFAHMVTTGFMKQGQIAKEFRMNPSDVSRMIAAVQLPAKILDKAREVDEEKKPRYSQSAVLELTGAPAKAREQAVELMAKDTPLTVTDVRELAKTARKAEDAAAVEAGEEPPTRAAGGARPHTREKVVTYRDLGVKESGEYLRFRVYGDRVEVTLTIPYENKTFRNFELVKAMKDTVNDTFANKELTIRSEEDLRKALSEARAQLSA
jgi:hypothetical protein